MTGAEEFTRQELKNLPGRSWRIYLTWSEGSTWQELKDLPDRSWRIYLTGAEGSTWQQLKDLPDINWRIYLTIPLATPSTSVSSGTWDLSLLLRTFCKRFPRVPPLLFFSSSTASSTTAQPIATCRRRLYAFNGFLTIDTSSSWNIWNDYILNQTFRWKIAFYKKKTFLF